MDSGEGSLRGFKAFGLAVAAGEGAVKEKTGFENVK
jgi:hypothetical protein